MKVAVVHSFYGGDVPSGENRLVESYADGLAKLGHEVLLMAAYTDELRHKFAYSVRSGLRVVTGFGAGFADEISDFKPDIVHVHNLFPNLGTRWLAQIDSPIVVTLHNFRSFCANGLFFREGHKCFECPEISALRSLRYGCYHDSKTATFPLTVSSLLKTPNRTLFETAQVLIAPSDLVRDIYLRFGTPSKKLIVIPHGVVGPSMVPSSPPERKWLFVGRLSPEKGLTQLLEIWPGKERLDIVGSSSDETAMREAPHNINFLGQRPKNEVEALMPNYMGLIFPSQCLETQGLVVLEAMSVGVPVVALEGNAGADTVSRYNIGSLYNDSETLDLALDRVEASWNLFHQNSRAAYENIFNSQRWLQTHVELFESLLEHRQC